MNAPLTTNANSGTPIALPSELRKRAHDAANGTADMVPEDWRGLVGGLLKFFKEEAAEPEHAGDIEPKTLYASRPLKNGDAVMAWARKAGFKKTLPAADMHVTVAFSKTPLAWPEPDRGGVIAPDANGDLNGTRSIEHLGDQGAIVLRFEAPALAARWQQLRDAGASWDYESFKPHITFTLDGEGVDLDKIEPYAGPLEFGPEDFKEIGTRDKDWAKNARASMVGADEEIDGIKIDREHDGPWMSCMSIAGDTMYVNKNLPRQAEIKGKTVDVDARLLKHEKPERADLEKQIQEFKDKNNREPDIEERKTIYQTAHLRSGVPGERAAVEAEDGDADAWNAWCRGEEAKLEKCPFTNPPTDADVRPIPHGHGDLAATDSALTLAFDKDSVRTFDRDGRMHVETANISKANVCPYRGKEIPGYQQLGLDPDRIYQLLRDPDELKKAAHTFNGIQLLRKHVPVNADDHQMWDIIGTTGSDASFDDPYLKNSLHFWTRDGIDLVESDAQKELSCGYHYRPDMTPGKFGDIPYDGVMRDIVGNHVALVKDGRAGDDVVVGDSTENLYMAANQKPTKFAALLVDRLGRGVFPLLAMDKKLELMPIVGGAILKNFKTDKPQIIAKLKADLKGNTIAQDADITHIVNMLDQLDKAGDNAEQAKVLDESVSEEQHKAMEAAAHGHSNLDIPKDVGKEFAEADKGKTFDDLSNFLKGKGMSEDDIEHVRGMMPKPVVDEEPDAEEEKRRKEMAAKDERIKAQDAEIAELRKAKEGTDEKMKDVVTKDEMTATLKAALAAQATSLRNNERDIRIALDEVKPYVGDLPNTLAFDSGDAVRRHALGMLGVENAAKITDTEALKTILGYQTKPGAKPTVRIAQDSKDKGGKTFAERHPELAHITAI